MLRDDIDEICHWDNAHGSQKIQLYTCIYCTFCSHVYTEQIQQQYQRNGSMGSYPEIVSMWKLHSIYLPPKNIEMKMFCGENEINACVSLFVYYLWIPHTRSHRHCDGLYFVLVFFGEIYKNIIRYTSVEPHRLEIFTHKS